MVLHNTQARFGAVIAATAAAALLLAGCASATPSASSSSGSGDSALVASAQKNVDAHTSNTTGFVPTDPITNIASLKGKTVIYIPAVAAIPIFATSFKAYADAFSKVGVTAKLCDGASNPSSVAACFQQAIDTKAGGVILDSLPPVIAQQAYDAVLAAKIPVALVTTARPDGSPDSVQLGGPDIVAATALAADAIIASTKGKAHVLAIRTIDSPTTQEWMDKGGVAELKKCSGCTVTTIDTKSADLANLPSKVSAALLADPSINYLFPQFSADVDGVIKGATDAGRSDLKGTNTVTTTGDLQKIAAGQTLEYSIGWDTVRESWMNSDMLMRLMAGQAVDGSKYTEPVRVFNSKNVKGLDLTQNGWDSSNWYGGTGYQTALEKLWSK
ncbi:MAG: substrate-binding domain-containing protein [Actinomycetota bacterium]